jgi:diguanylate cyclase (GGDEF)-like protein/PAS domain S-box-containing protein
MPLDYDYTYGLINKAQIQAHFEQKTLIYEVKHRLRHKDGRYVWVLSRGKVIRRDAGGRPLRMVGTTTDISALKESEDNYRHMVELHPQIPWVAAADGGILDVGPQWFVLTGIPQKEATPESWIEAVHLEDKAGIEHAWKLSLGTGNRLDAEYRLRRHDGGYAWIRARAAARKSPEGQVLRWYGTLEDVSDRYAAEEARRSSDALASRVLETTGDAVIVCNRAGKITFLNSNATALLGLSTAQIGNCIQELFTETHAVEIRDAIELAVGAGDAAHFEHFWPLTDMWLDVRLYVGVDDVSLFLRNISEQHLAQKELLHAASHDLMTGAINRTTLFTKLHDALTGQTPENMVALLCLDVDYFKDINDKYGHPAGDNLLRQIVNRLLSHLRRNDLLARSGGDEFLVMQTAVRTSADAVQLAERLNAAMQVAFNVDGISIKTSLSIGIAISNLGNSNGDGLYQQADRALYEAKKQARGAYRVFRPEMQSLIDKTSHLHMDLISAFAGDEFFLEFQPIIQLSSRRIVGAEALIRWNHPKRGVISPAEFIPIAEKSGLITRLGTWALSRACEAAHQWPETVRVSVNISPRQFELDDVYHMASDVLLASGLPAKRLKLEVTESVLLSQNSPNLQTLQDLRNLGITLVLDDFGTGYSSLSYLDMFKFDFVKIDKSFVSRIKKPGDRHQVFEAVMGMTKALELPATAEGIETAAQLKYVQSLGCDFVQGFYFAKPMTSDQLLRFMSSPLPLVF